MLAQGDPKDILELGDKDMHRGSSGVAAHQWVREVGHHEAKLQEAQGHLEGEATEVTHSLWPWGTTPPSSLPG